MVLGVDLGGFPQFGTRPNTPMLTDAQARKARPGEKDYKLADGGGLYLYVTTSGSKLWRQKYRYGGREKLLSHGPYPAVSLAEARRKRDEAKEHLRAGRDPAVEKKKEAIAAVAASDNTFEKVARKWFELNRAQWTETHASDVIGSLERDVFPTLGPLPLAAITPPMVLSVLRAIEERPAVETAHRIRQRISSVFVYAIAAGMAENDPAAIVKEALKPVIRGQFPAITNMKKVREMLQACEALPAHPVTKLGHRLLALTVVRPGTLLTTPWEEFDDLDQDEPLWRISAERMKLKKQHKNNPAREHWVPLPRQALEVIEVLRPLTSRGRYVLPNSRYFHRPMTEGAIRTLLNRAGYSGSHVPHGWRTSFSTIMNELYQSDAAVIDCMLAHVKKDKTERAYNRAKYLPRRRELAQLWADMLLEGFPHPSALLTGPRRRFFPK